MSQKAKCQATYSDFKRNVALISKNRKMSAIHGSSIRLQPNPPEYLIPSSRRRKRSAGKDDEEGASKAGEEGVSSGPASTATSFTKVLKRGAIHTAECCRLIIPSAFCEKYKVERNVTMTDSAGHKLWHMRFQSCGWLSSSRPSVYAISNGWREFSYDHGLKVKDGLVFTLLSTSHFLVEFATSNGSTRAMLPTRDGKDYPWKINYSRLNCLSYANDVDSSQVWQQAVKEKVILQKSVAPITLQEEEEEELRPISGGRRESPITLPNKQQPQKEMFCQCDTAKVGKGMNSTNESREEYVLPELTHLECKNPDGSSYLQIVDSDSEVTCVDED